MKKSELLTPPVTEGALDGITRQVVLDLAEKLGIKFRETPLAPDDVLTADECFLAGTGAELIPVGHADGRALPECPGPVYQRLSVAFKQLVNQEI